MAVRGSGDWKTHTEGKQRLKKKKAHEKGKQWIRVKTCSRKTLPTHPLL